MMDRPPTSISKAPGVEKHPGDQVISRFAWAFLILLTLNVCYFSHLGASGLIGPDEPRYAWIAREMAESGDWVTPRLYGRPWFEKPALYYWGAAISFQLFGVSAAAARLPSAFSALFATLALAWLALRMDGWETARWLLLLLPSTVAMIGFSHAASPDMIFSAAVAVAMVCAAVALGLVPIRAADENATDLSPQGYSANARYLGLALFGFFLGAAALAKGPAAVILAGGSMILWVAFTKRWREALRLFHPLAIGVFLATALPWYLACARRNPDFFRVFIVEHNFNRYLTPEFQHIQPFWYYLPITLVALLPWAFWLYGVEGSTRATATGRARTLFFAAWGLFPVLFFSLSKSKLPGYILPGVPALVLLIASVVTRTMKFRHSLGRYANVAVALLFFVIAGLAAFLRFKPAYGNVGPWVIEVGGALLFSFMIVAGLTAIVVGSAAYWHGAQAALISAIVGQLLLLALTYVVVGRLDPQLSARRPAAQIDAAGATKTYAFKLQRAWQYQLNFYLHREIPEWSADVAGQVLVVTCTKQLEELKKSAEIIAVVSDLSPQAEIVSVRPLPLARNVSGSGQPR
jgi:4-amino-4-deoxy-L-arabinose transferase-like glycosyltransferase